MDKKFEPNDIVKLRNGNIEMRVLKYYTEEHTMYNIVTETDLPAEETDMVICEWYDTKLKNYRQQRIKQDELEFIRKF